MPNIAIALKSEISRIARKEIKGETADLKKAAGAYRSEIAALKRRTQELEQQVRQISRRTQKAPPPVQVEEESSGKSRFSAKGLASQRRRLGLSAQELALLVGTSPQTVYNWEQGKVRPRPKQMPAIAALRTLGKKGARAALESVRQTADA